MQIVRVEEAVGSVLCHDITKIVPGRCKGPAFKKGHIIRETDIPELLSLGKDHVYVWELQAGFVHENEAGSRIARAIQGTGLEITEPSEGKVNLIAQHDGMFSVQEEFLTQMNTIEDIVIATRNNKRLVRRGDIVAGVRIIPLIIKEEKLKLVEGIGQKAEIAAVAPFRPRRVGIITTGSEVYQGRIKDRFGPGVAQKVAAFACTVSQHILVPDDADKIAEAVKVLSANGAELILTTGGMSVDPDDVTPAGIKQAGAEIITYGAPVLPGSMLMLAYLGEIPVLGLPGCVMYNKTTVFDLLLPFVLAGQRLARADIIKLGLGGLCLNCELCRYPACSFGTGL